MHKLRLDPGQRTGTLSAVIQSIEDVIDQLGDIVQSSIESNSPLGYFAALYKRVTISVRDGIARGDFDDNARMEKLDILFASRYLDAYRSFQNQEAVTASWKAAFQATSPKLITLQHLMLGMNAHISLDLGIAAAEAGQSDPLALRNDFYTINRVLEELIDNTQRRLTRIFGPLGLVDRLLGPTDEKLSIYSIAYARDKAWTQMLELSLAQTDQRDLLIRERDKSVAKFSTLITSPPQKTVRFLLFLIRALEKGTVSSRIEILNAQGAQRSYLIGK